MCIALGPVGEREIRELKKKLSVTAEAQLLNLHGTGYVKAHDEAAELHARLD